ncbi:MAG TPA: SDR family NAD(P)-dependent oxidoreductase [Candidatus Desulfobacillus sp.]|nr:SDR family NAD(P)-dependent oxidoreductase [Candidatus Desulfobacillus sp.]
MSGAASGLPLRGRHALVTGGGRGIGAAVAHSLAAHGARVTLLGRTQATLAAQADRLGGSDTARWQTADICDEASLRAAFERAAEAFGPVAILVNNAGQAAGAPFARTDPALWQRMLDINLSGTYFGIRAALPGMLELGWGRIINIASTAALKGYAYVAAYCAAKHGVLGLTRALAAELARQPVTVNAVCPGYTETDIVAETLANIQAKTGRSLEEARAELVRHNPQGRLVRPEEVAHAVLWLCLPGAEAITGQALSVSGGETT